MNFSIALSLITSSLLLSSCQTVYVPQARDVKRKPQASGVIALKAEHRAEDRQKAELMMQLNCKPKRFNIIEEGEVITGQETKTTGNETNRDDSRHPAGNLFGIPIMAGSAGGKEVQSSSTVTQTKEWQIAYNCESSSQKGQK